MRELMFTFAPAVLLMVFIVIAYVGISYVLGIRF